MDGILHPSYYYKIALRLSFVAFMPSFVSDDRYNQVKGEFRGLGYIYSTYKTDELYTGIIGSSRFPYIDEYPAINTGKAEYYITDDLIDKLSGDYERSIEICSSIFIAIINFKFLLHAQIFTFGIYGRTRRKI